MARVFLLVCIVFAGPCRFALAENAGSGLWLEQASGTGRIEALALSTEVDIQVTGLIAMTELRQRFFNQGGDWAEGLYRFPLPAGAAVERLEIRLGQRLIEGEIREREAARTNYEAARDSGRVAGLVERGSGNLFSTRVANIPPGETVEIRIGFTQPVAYEHGRFRLRFPTTAAPRYRPGAGLDPMVREHIAGATGEALPQRLIRLTVDLRPGLELAAIESTHHDIEIASLGSDWRVELAAGADGSGRDFELLWRPQDSGVAATALFAEAFAGREHAMLMLVPPQAFDAADTAREVVLVIDTSGSMANEPIVQALESLRYALASLRPGDRFNIIEFDHQARALFEQPQDFTPSRHAAALRWVDRLAAEGGTDMGPPLDMALAAGATDDHLRQVVFITDGMVGNERELIEQVALEAGKARLFTVGIGHGVNATFLERLARAGRGTYTAIAETSTIAERMSELVLQLESPVVHDIEIEWPVPVEAHPATLPDLYVGQPLMVLARAERLAGDVVVRGTSNGRYFERVLSLENFQPAPGVAVQWGRARIDGLENELVPPRESERQEALILDTALAYSLLSSQTSLVAVDRTPARSREAALKRHDLATSPAHGRAGNLRAMPATDAGSVPAAIRGGVALLLVLLLLFQRRINRDREGW